MSGSENRPAVTRQELATEAALQAQLEASAKRANQRLRIAVVIAHENYASTDIAVENYDDEESFVEFVDGGYWVEARVWVAADEVEGRMDDA